jgi:hypothetical protein
VPCNAVIAPDVARGLFDRLVAVQGTDGCTLDDVSTDRTQMTILWKASGTLLPAAEIVPRECATPDAVVGPAFAVRIPDQVRAACPATVQATVAIVQSDTFGSRTGVPWPAASLGAACIAVLAVVFLLEARRRRRARSG